MRSKALKHLTHFSTAVVLVAAAATIVSGEPSSCVWYWLSVVMIGLCLLLKVDRVV